MSHPIASIRSIFMLGVSLLSAYGLAGCSTGAQTAAAATTGGLLGIQLGVLALISSKLEITVDMYAPTEEQRNAMRLGHPPALVKLINDQIGADADPTQNPTPQSLVAVSVALRPIMATIEKHSAALERSIDQLRPQAAEYKNVIETLDNQRQMAVASVNAWKAFDLTLATSVLRVNEPSILRTLADQLSALRTRLLESARFGAVTNDYIDFMKGRMTEALIRDVNIASPKVQNATQLKDKISAAIRDIKDDPAAAGPARIAAVLDGVRQALPSVPGNHTSVDDMLSRFGFSLDSKRLLTLGSREAIMGALGSSSGALTAPPPPSGPSGAPTACAGASPVVVLPVCSYVGYSYTFEFNRATADVNLGPISNEVTQVLQAAGRGLSVITDPANVDRWRLGAAYAKSDAGAGNHNSIIYFENMGLPIVKSSAFDPTKFVVAQGALYRQVFSAAVATFGAPLPGTAGAAGAPDFQRSNIIATKAKIRNAEKATAAARQKIFDAMKAVIDEQKKVKSGNWSTNKAAIIKEAQDVLQGAASQLETTAGSN
jgi:hypothetical protein